MKKLLIRILKFIKKVIEFTLAYISPRKTRKYDYLQVKKAFDYFSEDEIKSSYNHFKKYFYNAVFLEQRDLQEHALRKALQNHKDNYFYLEFGVFNGLSINFFSKILKEKNINIYGFDSFEGLREDWSGTLNAPKGILDRRGLIPKLSSNCIPVKGWVQDTVPKFLNEHKNLKINFVHFDLDTYESTKDVFILIKPYLTKNAVILFDELYNYSGWSVGEYKALREVLDENEYKFISFSTHIKQAAIQLLDK